MIQRFAFTAAALAATLTAASAHEIVAEHAHAGPVILEAVPLPLIALAGLVAVVLGMSLLLRRKAQPTKRRDER